MEGQDENDDPEEGAVGGRQDEEVEEGVIAREIGETPKPIGKPAGKRARDKLEVQTRMLDLLEKDMASSSTTDPIELQFTAMCQRVKDGLPKNQQFSLAIKFAGMVEESIQAYERGQVLNQVQNIQPAGPVSLQMPPPQMPPPLINQMPGPQMNQMSGLPPMVPRQDGGFFNERQLTFTDL